MCPSPLPLSLNKIQKIAFIFPSLSSTIKIDKETQAWIITAITKILARSSQPSALFVEIDTIRLGFEARQRYAELKSIMKLCSPALLSDVLPYDGSCEDIEADPDLAFLNSFVQASLQNGARPYSKESSTTRKNDRDKISELDIKSNKDPALIFVYDHSVQEVPKSNLQDEPPQQQQQQQQPEFPHAKEDSELFTSTTDTKCSPPQNETRDDFV